MSKKKILINKTSLVKEFVDYASKVNGDVILTSENERYEINGKSIMGIFSLNLSKPLYVKSNVEDKNFSKFLSKIEA